MQRLCGVGAGLLLLLSCSPGAGNRQTAVIRIGAPTPEPAAAQPVAPSTLYQRTPAVPDVSTPAQQPLDRFEDLVSVRPPEAAKTRVLTRLIRATDSSDAQMADLLLRLAESLAADARYYRSRRQEVARERARANAQRRGVLQREEKTLDKQARRSLVMSVKVYAKIVGTAEYATFSRFDQVLAGYGAVLQHASNTLAARKAYKKLIQDHPQSTYVPEAFLSFGDYFYATGNLENALNFYEKTIAFPKSHVFAYALYKKGWALLGAKRDKEALETFEKALKSTDASEEGARLHLEVGRSLAVAYARAGDPKLAWTYFKSVDRASAGMLLEQLSLLQTKAGAPVQLGALREIQASEPERACELQAVLTRALVRSGDTDEARVARKTLTALLEDKPGDECWNAVLRLARQWHHRGATSGDRLAIAEALLLYAAHITGATDDSQRAATLFQYAELSWLEAKLERDPVRVVELWRQVGQRFDDAARAPASPHASEAREAARQARHNHGVLAQQR